MSIKIIKVLTILSIFTFAKSYSMESTKLKKEVNLTDATNVIKLFVWRGVEGDYYDRNKIKSFITGIDLNNCTLGVEYSDDDKEKIEFLTKFPLKLENIENKSFKSIIKQVNKFLKSKIKSQFPEVFPDVLKDMIFAYVSGTYFYPENSKEFYALPDQKVDELIKIYSEEFEKEK